MMEPEQNSELRIPPEALDEKGILLSPEEIPLQTLLEPDEIIRFSGALAALAQTECSVILYNPETPTSISPDIPIQFIHAPICRALSGIKRDGMAQCEWDVHAAGHQALEARRPIEADCVGGKSLLHACPILLEAGKRMHPKAAIVAAVNDIYCFDFADSLAEKLGEPLKSAQDMMMHTDKKYLNAEQLRRLRSIMEGYARSFSGQISERYAELQSIAAVMEHRNELQKAYGRLDEECAIVGEIQRSLVPQDNPDIKGYSIATFYSPATRAGGDYFDFLPLEDGSCGVFLADVSGHGPGAAVIMAMLRALVHAYPDDPRSPQMMLQYTNRNLTKNSLNDQFATAFYAVMEPEGHAHIASAGHNPPIYYCAANQEVFEPELDSGVPLGILPELDYFPVCLKMCTGDILVLYTDGFSEMMNESDDAYGVDRLIAVISKNSPGGANKVRDAVLRETDEFAASRPPEDDRALVVVQKL